MNIFVITGQTATGKTNYALEKARQENADILNFDSRQIYKRLDIVTGKDFEKPEFFKTDTLGSFDIGYYLIEGVKVWLYDIADPRQYFSSFDYVSCALQVMEKLEKTGTNVILTGGTYLYLYHLLYQVDTENISPDIKLRQSLATASVTQLQLRLGKIDALLLDSLNNSERNNPQRLIRKIEIATFYAARGEKVPLSMSYEYKKGLPGKIKEIAGLTFKNRESVRETIQKRVGVRIDQGAVEEVRRLLDSGYSLDDPGMRTIGYQELGSFILGKTTLAEAMELWITHEVQYTKRQLTFMKKDPHISWKYV